MSFISGLISPIRKLRSETRKTFCAAPCAWNPGVLNTSRRNRLGADWPWRTFSSHPKIAQRHHLGEMEGKKNISRNGTPLHSGQIIIIPKPEIFGHLEGILWSLIHQGCRGIPNPADRVLASNLREAIAWEKKNNRFVAEKGGGFYVMYPKHSSHANGHFPLRKFWVWGRFLLEKMDGFQLQDGPLPVVSQGYNSTYRGHQSPQLPMYTAIYI